MNKELKELRVFLTQCIYKIEDDTLSIKKANEITKMSIAVCQTYYLEKTYKEGQKCKLTKN